MPQQLMSRAIITVFVVVFEFPYLANNFGKIGQELCSYEEQAQQTNSNAFQMLVDYMKI